MINWLSTCEGLEARHEEHQRLAWMAAETLHSLRPLVTSVLLVGHHLEVTVTSKFELIKATRDPFKCMIGNALAGLADPHLFGLQVRFVTIPPMPHSGKES